MPTSPKHSRRQAARAAVRPAYYKGASAARAVRQRMPRTWRGRLLALALSLLVLGLLAFGIAYAAMPIPKPNQVAVAESSIIYYSDGKTEIDRISDVNRESVKLDRVPRHVQLAMLSAEDRSFYENNGISPRGIARSVKVAVGGGATQGGSTITQQYVKNYFLTQDRTISRKLKEILISLKIDGQLQKDQILENYLNTIYYGRGAYGIQTASKAYFNKDVSKLTPAQGALLAAVINSPSNYDPGAGEVQKKNAEARWHYVIDGMQQKGWLTAQQAEDARFPKVVPFKSYRGHPGPMGFVVQEVKNELRTKLKLSDADIDRGGLKIVTTIDRKRQDAAMEAVRKRMPTEGNAKDLHVGLVSMVPGDGAVVAMYGGDDYLKNQFNRATQAKLQAGSTFKPFTLIAALRKNISLNTYYSGASPQYFKEFSSPSGDWKSQAGYVANFGNHSYGTMDLRQATANSVNTVYAALNIKVTPKATRDAALAAGVTGKLGTNYSNVFGTDIVTVRDMARAYGTIAAQGKRADPYLIKKVTTSDKHYAYTAKPVTKQVLPKPVMADTIAAMRGVVQYGSGSYASQIVRPAAGKTGTTSDNYAAWFNGFTPDLETAVGIYKGDGYLKPANRMNAIDGVGEVTGGTIPVRIWTSYMIAALDGHEWKAFPDPANVGVPGGYPDQAPQQDTQQQWTPPSDQGQGQDQPQAPADPGTTTTSESTTASPSSTSDSSSSSSAPSSSSSASTTTSRPSSTSSSTAPSSSSTTSAPRSTATTPPPASASSQGRGNTTKTTH